MRPRKQAADASAAPPERRVRGKPVTPISQSEAFAFFAGGPVPVPSPAHRLQQALVSEYELPEVDKWHPAATLGFVLVTCGGFWAGVAFLAAKLF